MGVVCCQVYVCSISAICTEMASFASLESVPDVSEKPNQPLDLAFPKRQFGKTKVVNRSFQAQWFQKFRWLHYDQSRNLAFCHTCVSVVKSGKMKSAGNVDSAFISRGFCHWKDAQIACQIAARMPHE